ncbi:MAG: hypothetical protein ABSE86_23280 [Bryobacteraceae bacterium]|jgi:hypothetical protein
MIEQVLGSTAAIAEVDRRPAAGEPVTIEAVCQVVNGEPARTTLRTPGKANVMMGARSLADHTARKTADHRLRCGKLQLAENPIEIVR